MSAGKIDVLAAIDASLSACVCSPCPECDGMRKARAAVAELIEAAHDMQALAEALQDKRVQPTCSPAYRRMAAALARIGGNK